MAFCVPVALLGFASLLGCGHSLRLPCSRRRIHPHSPFIPEVKAFHFTCWTSRPSNSCLGSPWRIHPRAKRHLRIAVASTNLLSAVGCIRSCNSRAASEMVLTVLLVVSIYCTEISSRGKAVWVSGTSWPSPSLVRPPISSVLEEGLESTDV